MAALTLNEHSLRLEPVSEPCSHPRCARADEGVCKVAELVSLLAAEARDLGAVHFAHEHSGPDIVRVLFRSEASALSWRDVAALRSAEAGLDYFYPAMRPPRDGIYEVSLGIDEREVRRG